MGLTFISGMWVMSHRKALFIFLFVVFRAGFYFSQENDGSFNNIVSLSSPKTFLMSVPLIEKLLPLTFLQAKSFLAVSGVPRPDRQPQGCSSGIACCPAQPWSSPWSTCLFRNAALLEGRSLAYWAGRPSRTWVGKGHQALQTARTRENSHLEKLAMCLISRATLSHW